MQVTVNGKIWRCQKSSVAKDINKERKTMKSLLPNTMGISPNIMRYQYDKHEIKTRYKYRSNFNTVLF